MKHEAYFFVDHTESYFKILRKAYTDIQNDLDKDYLRFAFVTLCSSTLEYSLNHLIAAHYLHEFGPEDCNRFISSFVRLGFADKLHATPILITHGKFYFNKDHVTIKSLEELITLRNKILHKKGVIQKVEIPVSFDEVEAGMEVNFVIEDYINEITKDDCIKFGNALGSFKSELMKPYSENNIKKSELLLSNQSQ